jgi:hypothetical protein
MVHVGIVKVDAPFPYEHDAHQRETANLTSKDGSWSMTFVVKVAPGTYRVGAGCPYDAATYDRSTMPRWEIPDTTLVVT